LHSSPIFKWHLSSIVEESSQSSKMEGKCHPQLFPDRLRRVDTAAIWVRMIEQNFLKTMNIHTDSSPYGAFISSPLDVDYKLNLPRIPLQPGMQLLLQTRITATADLYFGLKECI